MPELTIVIPIHNNYKLTATCLSHIFHNIYPQDQMQIIIVDNNSKDKTEFFIRYLITKENLPIIYIPFTEKHANVMGISPTGPFSKDYDKIVGPSKQGQGYLKGTNIGWQLVQTPYVMLLNNDVFMAHACIEYMMNAAKSSEKIGIVGGSEFLPEGRPSKVKPFIFFNREDLSAANHLRDYKDLNIPEDSEIVDVEDMGFACVVIKKEVWDKIGYFDEQFAPCMYEQEDYCLRSKLAGFRNVIAVKAEFVHHVGSTTADNWQFYQEVLKNNRKKFFNKWQGVFQTGSVSF